MVRVGAMAIALGKTSNVFSRARIQPRQNLRQRQRQRLLQNRRQWLQVDATIKFA
jgi:hypothetical protein